MVCNFVMNWVHHPAGLFPREEPVPCLGSSAGWDWHSMNATGLKGGGEELTPKLFLSIAIILAVFFFFMRSRVLAGVGMPSSRIRPGCFCPAMKLYSSMWKIFLF